MGVRRAPYLLRRNRGPFVDIPEQHSLTVPQNYFQITANNTSITVSTAFTLSPRQEILLWNGKKTLPLYFEMVLQYYVRKLHTGELKISNV